MNHDPDEIAKETESEASTHLPLYTMDPEGRFSDRAAAYVSYRPSYPEGAIAAILDGLSNSARLVAADIGAGTGIAARLLADQDVQVWAIEPNAEMKSAAGLHSGITWKTGTAEQTGLATACVDLVTCFQAFHWFNPALCLPEFHRILRPHGRLAVVWNVRDRSDPLTAGYSAIVEELSHNHPAGSRMAAAAPLETCAEFTNLRQLAFPYSHPLDLQGLIGRAQSVSYVPNDPQTQRQLTAKLTALYEQFAFQGEVHMVYTTQVFLLDKV
jgi:SAM-dependent methyltransferase